MRTGAETENLALERSWISASFVSTSNLLVSCKGNLGASSLWTESAEGSMPEVVVPDLMRFRQVGTAHAVPIFRKPL